MSIIYVLIPIAMIFVLLAVGIFFWAVKSDQFEDLERQSVSILFEEDAGNKLSSETVNDPSSSPCVSMPNKQES